MIYLRLVDYGLGLFAFLLGFVECSVGAFDM